MIGRLLPERGPLRWLAVGNFVNMTGTGASLAALVVFLAQVKQLPLTQVTTVLTVAGLIGVLGAVPVGHLSDRLGARATAVASELACAAAVLALLPLRNVWLLALVLALRQLAVSGNTVARAALMGRIVPSDQRVRLRAYQRSVTNVGFALGSLIAGLAIAHGAEALRMLLVLDAATFAFAAFATARLPDVRFVTPRTLSNDGHAPPPIPTDRVLRDLPYIFAALLNALHNLNGAVVAVGVPLWVVYASGLPTWSTSLALGLNTVIVVILQVPLSRYAKVLGQTGRSMALAGGLTALGCGTLALSPIVADQRAFEAVILWAAFGAACVSFAVAEVLDAAAGWTLSYDLAPDHSLGRYQGLWQLTSDGVAKAVGPALIGASIGAGPLGLGGLAAGFALLAGATPTWTTRILASHADRKRDQSPEQNS